VPEPTVLRKRIVEVVNESQPAWDDGPTLFHGAQGRIEGDVLDPTGGGADIHNLFGPGFYTTDAQHVAASYAGNPGQHNVFDPFLYEVRFKGDGAPRVIDFDAVPTPAERKMWNDAATSLWGNATEEEVMGLIDELWVDELLGRGESEVWALEIWGEKGIPDADVTEAINQLKQELILAAERRTNGESWEALRRQVDMIASRSDLHADASWSYQGPGFPSATEALRADTERFLNQQILGEHFDAITHRGGIRRGGLGEHEVHIWLDPENIDITPSAASDKLLDLNEELRAATRHTDTILETGDPVNLTVAQIDEIAKGHALDDTKGLLYDLTERSQ
ncbi:MAG: hypothetical protein GY701_15115, partial [Sulfitobacter sp.]|nr:hypothetical protein [Sulfitobacter sp.]